MRKQALHHLRQIEAVAPYLQRADVIDIKRTPETALSLRQLVAGLLSYQPGWVTALYRVRWGFVRLLGMTQEGVPRPKAMHPDDVPLEAGQPAYFFTVEAAEDDRFWLAGATDKHLDAYILAARADERHFYVVTLVMHKHWTGPVYYNVIRPFHHLVVWAMLRRALKPV